LRTIDDGDESEEAEEFIEDKGKLSSFAAYMAARRGENAAHGPVLEDADDEEEESEDEEAEDEFDGSGKFEDEEDDADDEQDTSNFDGLDDAPVADQGDDEEPENSLEDQDDYTQHCYKDGFKVD
jgi:hypothetical protein